MEFTVNPIRFSPVFITSLITVGIVGKETNGLNIKIYWFIFQGAPHSSGSLFLAGHCCENHGNGAMVQPNHNTATVNMYVFKMFTSKIQIIFWTHLCRAIDKRSFAGIDKKIYWFEVLQPNTDEKKLPLNKALLMSIQNMLCKAKNAFEHSQMCRFSSSCTCKKYRPGLCSSFIHSGVFFPSADSRTAVVSFWRKNMHSTGLLLRGLSLPSKTVVR